jgi:hypothetical protein
VRFTVPGVLSGLALGAALGGAVFLLFVRDGDDERAVAAGITFSQAAQLRSGTPRAAVIRRLGQPKGVGAGSGRSCVYYAIVDQPAAAWELCFRRGRLESRSTVIRR